MWATIPDRLPHPSMSKARGERGEAMGGLSAPPQTAASKQSTQIVNGLLVEGSKPGSRAMHFSKHSSDSSSAKPRRGGGPTTIYIYMNCRISSLKTSNQNLNKLCPTLNVHLANFFCLHCFVQCAGFPLVCKTVSMD